MVKEIKEEVLTFFEQSGTRPLSVDEIEQTLSYDHSEDFKNLIKALNELEQEGELVRTRKNRFGLPNKMNLIRGKIQMHKKGFAFLIPDDEDQDDVYIHYSDLHTAMNNDVVLVRLEKKGERSNRPEGTVVRIIERVNTKVVGNYEGSKGYGFVIADDKRIPHDIFIPKDMTNGAVTGHKVIVEITKYPEGKKSAEGAIVSILGHKNDPGIDIMAIIHKNGIPIEFPEEVLEQAQAIGQEVSDDEIARRRDVRDETVVTIDGADAKDLDDAIGLTRKENGNFLLTVHISDVSYYIPTDSPMDKEALERGTSVYLVDRVIPMIPHTLSNGICSLNPNVDRLTLACEMEIDATGKVVNHEIFEAVIRSSERMTYTSVNIILEDKDEEERARYEQLVPMFEQMEQLAAILRAKRMDRGAIDFDFKEAYIIVNDEGCVEDIGIRERSVGEKLIEEFMLVTNETIAEHFHWLDVPFIHRIHEDPDEGKLQNFFEFLAGLGHTVKGTANDIHPRALQKVLEQVAGEPEEMIISKLMLRSLKKAKYDPQNVGHFGLASEFYTHFTAPIRRYPDLTVHRLIRTYLLDGKMDKKTQDKWQEKLPAIAEHTSDRERTAIEAEREVNDLKKAEFMQDKIGEQFTGVISSVTNFGLFVELENTVEGLVHVSYMTDDYYHFDERSYAMIGERTGNVYRIGQEVEIKVIGVNMEERAVDFELV